MTLEVLEALAEDDAEEAVEAEKVEEAAFEAWGAPVLKLWDPEWLLALLLDDVVEVDFFLVPDELLF